MNQNKYLFEAISFVARAHRHQVRKDGETPYVSHVFRVAMTLAHVFGVKDPEILTAAVLHDTIEDTTTDFDDLEERFGLKIAEWVALLSKNKCLPEKKREAVYCTQLSTAPPEVKLIKLADLHDNLLDSTTADAKQQSKSIAKAKVYLKALEQKPPTMLKAPLTIVRKLVASSC